MSSVNLPGFDEASPVRQNAAIRQIAEKLATYAPLASPTFTGDPKAPTPATADNDTSIATTAFVKSVVADYAPLASPGFTGNPTAPTPSPGDNDTSIATTAFVTGAIAGFVPNTREIATTSGELTGGGDLSANRTLGLVDTAVTPGSYTLASITVDAKGRVTAASNGSVTPTWETSIKTSGQTLTSSTTFTDVTDLSFPVSAGSYAFTAIVIGASGGGGCNLAVNGPTLTDMRAGVGSVVATAYDTSLYTVGASTNFVATISGVVTVSASGTVSMRFKQTSSDAVGCTIVLGSSIQWALVA